MSTADPDSVAQLQAQVQQLVGELEVARAQVAALQSSQPPSGVVSQLDQFRSNMQVIANQAITGVAQTHSQLLDRLSTSLNLPNNSDEHYVLIAMRSNEPYRLATVVQAKALLGK